MSFALKLRIGTEPLPSLFVRKHVIEIEPTSSSLILRALGKDYYERKRKTPKIDCVTLHKGNITFDEVKTIARTLDHHGKNLSKDMTGMYKSVLGTV